MQVILKIETYNKLSNKVTAASNTSLERCTVWEGFTHHTVLGDVLTGLWLLLVVDKP
jgi:hypothetical protein